jgi:hypothetical protein
LLIDCRRQQHDRRSAQTGDVVTLPLDEIMVGEGKMMGSLPRRCSIYRPAADGVVRFASSWVGGHYGIGPEFTRWSTACALVMVSSRSRLMRPGTVLLDENRLGLFVDAEEQTHWHNLQEKPTVRY